MSLFSLDELLFFVYVYTFSIKLIFLACEGFIALLYLPVLIYCKLYVPRRIEVRELKNISHYYPYCFVKNESIDSCAISGISSPVVAVSPAISLVEEKSSKSVVACCPWATIIVVGSNTMCICIDCETDDDSLSEADLTSAIDKDDRLVSEGVCSVVAVSGVTDTVDTVVVGSNTAVGNLNNKSDVVSKNPEVYTSESIDTESDLPDPSLSGKVNYTLCSVGVSLAAARSNTSSDIMDTDVPSFEENNPFVLPCVSVVGPHVFYNEINTTFNTSSNVDFGDRVFSIVDYSISTCTGTGVITNTSFTSGGGACAAVYGKKKTLPKNLGVLSSSGRVVKRVPFGKNSRRVARVVGAVCFPGQPVVSIKPGFIPSLPLKSIVDTKESNIFVQVEANEEKEVKEDRNLLGAEDVEDKNEISPLETKVEESVVGDKLSASSGVIVDEPEKSNKRKHQVIGKEFSFNPNSSVVELESASDFTSRNPFGLNSFVLSGIKESGKGRDLLEEYNSLKKPVVAPVVPAIKTSSYSKLSLDDPFGSSPIDSLYARTLEAKKKMSDDKAPRKEEKGKRPERVFLPANKKEERKILKLKTPSRRKD